MGKFYAVRRGKKTGLFTDWSSCQESIKGYSGAEYKSFADEESALLYLMGETPVDPKKISEVQQITDTHTLNVFTDGIYIGQNSYCGLVMITESLTETKEYICGITDSFCDKSKTIASSLLSAFAGLHLAVSQEEYTNINIYNKYDGIKKWANGDYTPSSMVACEFVRAIRDYNKTKRVNVYQLTDADKAIKQKLKYYTGLAATTNSRISLDQLIKGNIFDETLENVE